MGCHVNFLFLVGCQEIQPANVAHWQAVTWQLLPPLHGSEV